MVTIYFVEKNRTATVLQAMRLLNTALNGGRKLESGHQTI